MKKIILFFFPLFQLMACVKPQIVMKNIPSAGEHIRIAVLPFKDAPNAPGSGAIAAEALNTHLLKISAYEIIERNNLEKLLQEQQLGMTGVIEPETASQLGKILGVDALVIGTVTQVQKRKNMVLPPARATLTARMVRTQTGAVDWTATHTQGWHPLKWLCFFPPPAVVLGPVAIMTSPTAEDCIQKASQKIAEELTFRIQGKETKK